MRNIKNISITAILLLVVTSLSAQNNSKFISQTAPTQVELGEAFTVSVTFENTGSSTWTSEDNYRMGTQSPQDNTIWGIGNRVELPGPVMPGKQVTFTVDLTAPSTSDGYAVNLQWRIVRDGVAWFGSYSEPVSIAVGSSILPDSLIRTGTAFSVSSHIVGTSLFHWYGKGEWQIVSPWIPIEGRKSWTGEVPYWKRMIKQIMAANIEVLYVLVIPAMEQSRTNFFRALNELRREGWEVPKVCPFFDPIITYSTLGTHGNAATEAGKDEIVDHYIRFYRQYYSVNTDEFADDFIYTQDQIPVLNTWHVHLHIDNYSQMTRADISDRLSAEFGAEHPIFNNGIKMITNAISPSYSFADEKVHQFEAQEYYIEKNRNGVITAQLKPGYWDQNVRNPGFFLPRDGGSHYKNSWNQIGSSVDRVYIESFNEYDEGSGIYASKCDTIYTKTDEGMNNTYTDTWSSTDDPYEYIKTTAKGAALFNDFEALDATILWNNIPDTMSRAETFMATVVVRNDGDATWNSESGFKLGEMESLDPDLFGPTRYLIDDTSNDIPVYGGIFKGRAITFNIEVTAPDETGTYTTYWGMLQEGVAWFGDTLEVPITVSQAYHRTENEIICTGDSLWWHGAYLSQTGSYYDSLTTMSGDDSICQLDLTVLTLEAGVTQNNNSLTANTSNAVYQWINCETSDPVPGETGQTFKATKNGEYAVVVSMGACSDTSSCYSITNVGIQDECEKGTPFNLYPNPVSIDGLIRIDGDFHKNDRVVLLSLKGNVMYETKIQANQNRISLAPRTYNMMEGIYIIQIIGNRNIHTAKILVGK